MVDQITVTAAGTAAGTAVDLARLGVEVACIGAVGNDELGTFLLLMMMRDRGIDVLGVQRTDRAQTSATVLPIRPNGDRPALHVVGANAHRNRDGVLTLLPTSTGCFRTTRSSAVSSNWTTQSRPAVLHSTLERVGSLFRSGPMGVSW